MCSTPDFFMNHAIELHTRYGLVYRQRSSVCLSSPEMYHCVLSITVFLKPVNEPCFVRRSIDTSVYRINRLNLKRYFFHPFL